MSEGRILLLEGIDPGAKDSLEGGGYEVELLPKSLPEDALVSALAGAVAVGIRSKTHLTAQVLDAAADLRAIGAFCIGTNQIDLERAHHHGVPAFNAPFSNTRSVAELVMAEVVFLARKTGDRNLEMHQGQWKKSAAGSHEIRGKTIGIVGYGHIGRQVGVLAEAFGMKVLFYDVASRLPMGNNVPAPGLEELLANSHFVTLHVPQTPETANMIGAAELRHMREGSYLLNLSRGNVVVIEALAEALRSGHLAGAALDVYPEEPETRDAPFSTPLAGLPNVILTPHVGGSTVEAQVAIGQEVAATLLRYLRAGTTIGAVNFPQVDLADRAGAHRIQHIHDNVPGVLEAVHHVITEKRVNILGEALVTDNDIGYLLIDVADAGDAICAELAKLPRTRRVRRLT
ncbi:MAG: phosphoglycerate dehydrogenase [Sandaracinaceae bacterium]